MRAHLLCRQSTIRGGIGYAPTMHLPLFTLARKPLNIKVTSDGQHHGVSPDKADFKGAPHDSINTIAPPRQFYYLSPVIRSNYRKDIVDQYLLQYYLLQYLLIVDLPNESQRTPGPVNIQPKQEFKATNGQTILSPRHVRRHYVPRRKPRIPQNFDDFTSKLWQYATTETSS